MVAGSWIGALWDVPRYGMANLWPMIVFLLGYSYLCIPLIIDFGKLLLADRAARRAVQPVRELALGSAA